LVTRRSASAGPGVVAIPSSNSTLRPSQTSPRYCAAISAGSPGPMSPVPWTLATCLIAYIAYKEYPHTDMVPRGRSSSCHPSSTALQQTGFRQTGLGRPSEGRQTAFLRIPTTVDAVSMDLRRIRSGRTIPRGPPRRATSEAKQHCQNRRLPYLARRRIFTDHSGGQGADDDGCGRRTRHQW